MTTERRPSRSSAYRPGWVVIAAGCALAVVGACTPHSPTEDNTRSQSAGIKVTAKADALLAPDIGRLDAGPRRFAVSTPDASASPTENHWVGLVRPNNGVSIERLALTLREAMFGKDPRRQSAADREVQNTSTSPGGVSVHQNAPQSFTAMLRPGTYYLLDYQLLTKPDPTKYMHRIKVEGTSSEAMPPSDAALVGTQRDGVPRFQAPRTLSTTSDVRLVNAMNRPHEAILLDVANGTTEADLRRYFEQSAAGENPPSPFTGSATGSIPLSPGTTMVLHLQLPAGTYALTSWVAGEDGSPQAMAGMNTIITVR